MSLAGANFNKLARSSDLRKVVEWSARLDGYVEQLNELSATLAAVAKRAPSPAEAFAKHLASLPPDQRAKELSKVTGGGDERRGH